MENTSVSFIWNNKVLRLATYSGENKVQENLLLKKIVDEDVYDECGQECETVGHIVLYCQFAKKNYGRK